MQFMNIVLIHGTFLTVLETFIYSIRTVCILLLHAVSQRKRKREQAFQKRDVSDIEFCSSTKYGSE